jgi:hypothetical protein
MRRVNSLSNRFESRCHALAFDFFFARVHRTLWRDPAMAAGVVGRNLGKETCIFVIGARRVAGNRGRHLDAHPLPGGPPGEGELPVLGKSVSSKSVTSGFVQTVSAVV